MFYGQRTVVSSMPGDVDLNLTHCVLMLVVRLVVGTLRVSLRRRVLINQARGISQRSANFMRKR